jgi:two-component system LytT family sensor kinase
MSPEPAPGRLIRWDARGILIVTGVWTALVVMSVASGALWAEQSGREFDYATAFTQRGIDWFSCAVFTPLFIWCARTHPIDRTNWRTSVPVWLALTVAATPLKFVLQYALLHVLAEPPSLSLGALIVGGFMPELIAFWAMAAVIMSIEYYERWRQQDLQTHLLGRQLAEARLEMLTAQLQPHFLFNTLQSISTLLYRDTAGADRMLGQLGDLLRRTLNSASAPEVTLDEELATLEHYVAIQRVRFQDRLRVHIDCDGAGRALVPNFVLQPLVENAIEHGIARSAGPGRIDIAARRLDGRLELSVRDDAAASHDPAPRASRGIGLANTRERLAALYGADASLAVAARPGGGFEAVITLPLRLAPEHDA